MRPLDTGLNIAIIDIGSKLFPCGFDVSDHAPSTLEELRARLDAGSRMLVFAGGSERTIYADREVNWAFRAWHDWCHWRGRHAFTPDGERAVCDLQTTHLRMLFGNSAAETWGGIIRAEIIGQGEYLQYHNRFPDDQHGFVDAYLRDRDKALRWPNW